ncbi:uncharacterized protein Tco025E_07573 [Trypanosoma conorhini]|uniref:Uncharacterized protein n=1 Tax=Trypanosoma conorhini TaxID=83891 RepID=A0A3R7L400_9TRYP|nr:uncharacterized protein Tco025E_07573 [Trypanosoma conorhini]RNF07103.1 hypothetical protein Tco025E_07573 [Trypanosoma conorhini]
MYNLDFLLQPHPSELSYTYSEPPQPQRASSQNDDHDAPANSFPKDGVYNFPDSLSENYLRDYSEAVPASREDAGKTGSPVINSSKGAVADYKPAMCDYPALETSASRGNKKHPSAALSTASSRINRSGVYDTAHPYFSQLDQDNQSNFGYGLDALLNGVELGFGPQPSYPVASPSSLPGAAHKSQDADYDLEEVHNEKIPAEVYFPRSAAPVSALSGLHKKISSASSVSVNGQTKSNETFTGEKVIYCAEYPSLAVPLLRESLGGEARGYMQDAGLFRNQFFGENEKSGSGSNVPSAPLDSRKVHAAELEALMTVPPSSGAASSVSAVSNGRGKTGLVFSAKGNRATRRYRPSVEGTQDAFEKRRSSDMEYPAFDAHSFRESFYWPNSSHQALHALPPAVERGKKNLGPPVAQRSL